MKTKNKIVIFPPCGESVALATKEGQNRKNALWPLLPRLTAVLPPQGREMRRGFTLIELLVVVLIIGILAAVAVPQYQKAVVKSQLSTLKSLVATVSNAIEVYYLAHGSYPKTLSELDVDIPAPISATYDEENSVDIATYPWGFCYLSNVLFQCNNTQVNIAYIQRFLHIYVRSGARSCSALENNATAIAVCKQETGQTSYYYQGPTATDTTVESYQYQ